MPSGAYSGSTLALVLTIGVTLATVVPVVASSRAAIPMASAPDLAPTDMTFSPEIVEEYEVVQLAVRVENRGAVAAAAATLRFLDRHPDGHLESIGEISLLVPLDPDTSVLLAGPAFVAVGLGEHTLTVRVVEVSPQDPDPSNDAHSILMTVKPRGSNPGLPPPSDDVRIQSLATLGLGGAAVVVVLALAGFAISVGLRARPDETLVPPPPEPPDRRPPPIWPP